MIFFFKPTALTLKRFVVGFLVSKKVIVFLFFFRFFFFFLKRGEGKGGLRKETILTGRSRMELQSPGS